MVPIVAVSVVSDPSDYSFNEQTYFLAHRPNGRWPVINSLIV